METIKNGSNEPKITPTEEKNLKSQTFPIWAMPKDTQKLITEASIVHGLPSEMFAIPMLSAVAVAIGNKAELRYKNYINYPQIWGAIVGDSGTNKTLAGTIAFKPIREHDKKTYETYIECAKNNEKTVLKNLTTQDATLEGLTVTMKNNNNTMCYNPDELDSFFQTIVGRYKSASDAGQYLSMFSNQQISVHRAGKDKEPILLEAPILSICGTIQPEILKKNIAKYNLVDSGFLQRFLFVYPENIVEQPENDLVIPENVIDEYCEFIKSLLQSNDKKIYEIDVSAKSEFIVCLNKFKEKRNAAIENPFSRSMLAKLEISFHRFCVIIEHANNKGTTSTVSCETGRCAWALIMFFWEESKKISTLIVSNEKQISMGDVCKFIEKKYPDKKKTEIAKFFGMTKQSFNHYVKHTN